MTVMDNERLLYRIEDAASDVLGIGRSKCFELIRSGEIATVKIGRRTLISRASLEAYVERLRVGTAQT